MPLGDADLAAIASPATADAMRSALGHLVGGVSVVAAHWRGNDFATTISSLLSVSLTPPMVLITVHEDSRMRDCLAEQSSWAVSLLAADAAPAAEWFAMPGRPIAGQFDRIDHHRGPASGAPLLDGALAWLECRTAKLVDAGDHVVVLGDVTGVLGGVDQRAPLIHLRGRLQAGPAS